MSTISQRSSRSIDSHVIHHAVAGAVLCLAALAPPALAAPGDIYDLGSLSAGGTEGHDVNDAGQVTGTSLAANPISHAFRYDGTPGSGGVMRDLGTLGGTYSNGLGINDAGQVVGSSLAADNSNLAFLYTGTPDAGGQMIDLDAWLDANNPAAGAKWTLIQAFAISNTGWVTGEGLYDPDGPSGVIPYNSTFLLDASALVPEPAGLALLSLAGALSLRRRRGTRASF